MKYQDEGNLNKNALILLCPKTKKRKMEIEIEMKEESSVIGSDCNHNYNHQPLINSQWSVISAALNSDPLSSLYENNKDWAGLSSLFNCSLEIKDCHRFFEDTSLRELTLQIWDDSLKKDSTDLSVKILQVLVPNLALSIIDTNDSSANYEANFNFQVQLLKSTASASQTGCKKLFDTLLSLWDLLSCDDKHHSSLINTLKINEVFNQVTKFGSFPALLL